MLIYIRFLGFIHNLKCRAIFACSAIILFLNSLPPLLFFLTGHLTSVYSSGGGSDSDVLDPRNTYCLHSEVVSY